jgi:DnaJ family protein C protein 2
LSRQTARKFAKENSSMSAEQLAEREENEVKSNERKFLRVQQALDVLTDSRKRQAFDSEEELLEIALPSLSELQDPSKFFIIIRPIFQRFSYFSVRKPVPELGDESSPIEEVERFYDFWNGFQSWRDFSHEDEYDPEEASCREEKRWMERVSVNLVV